MKYRIVRSKEMIARSKEMIVRCEISKRQSEHQLLVNQISELLEQLAEIDKKIDIKKARLERLENEIETLKQM